MNNPSLQTCYAIQATPSRILNNYFRRIMKIESIERFLLGVLLCLVISCIPNSRCDFNGTHDFLIPSTLTPALDTFSVGDTIFFSSIFEDRVYDRGLEEHVVLSDFKFNPLTQINRLDTTEITSALSFFTILIDDLYDPGFTFAEEGPIMWSNYYYHNGTYKLEYRMIPRKKGLFLFQYGLSLNSTPNQTFEGMCRNLRGWLDSYSDLNGTADNNIEYLELSPNSHYNDWILQKPEDRFYSKGGYCFFVKK